MNFIYETEKENESAASGSNSELETEMKSLGMQRRSPGFGFWSFHLCFALKEELN